MRYAWPNWLYKDYSSKKAILKTWMLSWKIKSDNYKLLSNKKDAQNIWSWDLVHEESFGYRIFILSFSFVISSFYY